MPLLGIAREGAGGSGYMPLRFIDLGTGLPVVSATVFGAAATTDRRAVIACVATPGVPHTPARDDARRQLHLVILAQDGRDSIQYTGPQGRGIWFGGGSSDDWFAIGATDAGAVFVHRWSLVSPSSVPWPVGVNNPALAAALLNGRFAAAVSSRGALHVVVDSPQPTVFVVEPDGQRATFPLIATAPRTRLQLVTGAKRLIFRSNRMLLVCVDPTPRPPRLPAAPATVRAFNVSGNRSDIDATWGTAGVWTAPAGFSPVDLLSCSNGQLVCVGWTAVGGASSLTTMRIESDGRSHTTRTNTPIPTPLAIRTAVDSQNGLLIAGSVPNPVSAILGPLGPPANALAEWGLVSRRNRHDIQDYGFGNQGACWATFPGYPIDVREVVPTANGFYLVCNRTAGIQRSNMQPVVYAYGLSGYAINGFGETGIVHHDEIPSMIQLFEPTRVVTAGPRRVWNPNPSGPDTFELAVTFLGPTGYILWRYGSTQEMHSAPLIIAAQQIEAFGVTAITNWGGLLAIGGWYAGPNGGGGFVTFRGQNGESLPGGQGPVTFVNAVMHLEPAANGMLEVTTPVPGAYMEKALIQPGLTLNPSPPVPVPAPQPGLLLPDGSRVNVHEAIFTGAAPLLRVWLTRVRPDGTIDPIFGGRNAAAPVAGMSNDRTSFDGVAVDNLDVRGTFPDPAGGYLVCMIPKHSYLFGSTPTPLGLLVTRWNADGSPGLAWGNAGAVEHPGIVIINQVVADNPAGLVLVGAASPPRTDSRIPTLWRIRYSDGQLDPTFGQQGVLSVSLRRNENRMASEIRIRADGTGFVPIASSDTSSREPEDLIWIEIA